MIVVGDVACSPSDSAFNGGNGTSTACRQRATSDVALYSQPDVVAIVGDSQYADGVYSDFMASYDKSWGRLKSRTRPAVGNHEMHTGGAGFSEYFGELAGPRSTFYYSYDVGTWHVVVLNSNCAAVSCSAGSAQERWLRADLAAHPARCTVAYMHHPRFSSGDHGNATEVRPLWDALYAGRADLVLAGHDHDYERFAKMRPDGSVDEVNGIRSFVVGSGGKGFRPFGSIQPNSLARNASVFGVLRLQLGSSGYTWAFVPEAGKSYADSGTGTCAA